MLSFEYSHLNLGLEIRPCHLFKETNLWRKRVGVSLSFWVSQICRSLSRSSKDIYFTRFAQISTGPLTNDKERAWSLGHSLGLRLERTSLEKVVQTSPRFNAFEAGQITGIIGSLVDSKASHRRCKFLGLCEFVKVRATGAVTGNQIWSFGAQKGNLFSTSNT